MIPVERREKYPAEILRLGIDWEASLDGAAIATVDGVEVLGSSASAPLVVTLLPLQGTVLPVQVEGGQPKLAGQRILATVTPVGGEKLQCLVIIDVVQP